MSTQSIASKPRFRFRWTRVIIYAILISFSIFYVVPVYLILITSFKQYTDINLYRMWEFPSVLNLGECTNPFIFCFDSFYEAWVGGPSMIIGFNQAFMNSVKMSMPATIISTILGSLNGYGLSKWKFKYADIIFPVVLFGMFIP